MNSVIKWSTSEARRCDLVRVHVSVSTTLISVPTEAERNANPAQADVRIHSRETKKTMAAELCHIKLRLCQDSDKGQPAGCNGIQGSRCQAIVCKALTQA
jgi:hypothetical protein